MPYFPPVGGSVLPLNSIDNTLLADMADGTVKGRALGAGAGDPTDLTQAQLAAVLAASVPAYSYRNILGRNGGLEVWQRGAGGAASFALAAAGQQYTADGWYPYANASQALTISQQAGITNGSRYCMRIQRNAGQTGVGSQSTEFPLDTDEIVAARGQFVTLSMTLRAGANFSGSVTNFALFTGTGTPARRGLGAYTGDAAPINGGPVVPTTTATRYTFVSSVPIGAAVTQASLFMTWTPVGTAGAADYFELDDVQLEIGAVATPFERRPFADELRLCQRHFWKSFKYEVAPATNTTPGIAGAGGEIGWTNINPSTRAGAEVQFPVPMRVSPVMTTYNPAAANAQARETLSNTDCTGTTFPANATDRHAYVAAVGPAGGTQGGYSCVHVTADASI